MNNRLVRMLLTQDRGGQIGVDLYNHAYFDKVHPAITTRTVTSNNYFIIMNEDKTTKVAMTLDEGKWAKMHEQSRRVYDTDALAPTMQTCGGGQREPKILTRPHGYYKGEVKEKVAPAVKASAYAENNYLQEPLNAMPDGTATTLTTAHHYSGNIINPKRGQTEMGVRENFRIRKLTPRECFRLMDVDDKDIDTIQAAGISDSQQYKLAGNSIVVNVLTEIFRKLLVDTQNDDRQLRMF